MPSFDIITGLTAIIGVLVILAALYLQQEKTAKTKYTPLAEPRKRRRKKKKTSSKKSSQPTPLPKKSSAKKKASSKSSSKSSSKKKKATAAPVATQSTESKTAKKKTKVDNIAGTAKDGTTGVFASSFKAVKGDDEGWEVKVAPAKKSRSPKKSSEETKDGRTSQQITVKNLGKLIGRQGETISRITADSGAKIDTPDRGSGNKVTVSGTAEEVATAIALIKKEIGPDDSPAKPAFSTKIHVNNVGRLIGKGGETIKRLSSGGAQIDIPKDRKDTGNIVTISGASQNIVDECVTEIKEVLGEDSARPTEFSTMTIKPDQCALIIGRRGATVDKIKEDSGVDRIQLDRDSGVCKISGSSKEVVNAARKAINAILTKDANTTTESMECDSKNFGAVIGSGGAAIRAVESEYDVSVTVDKSNNRIKIRGSKQNVGKVIAKYTKMLAEQKDAGPFGPLTEGHKFEIIPVADNSKGRIIGSGGATIKKLQSESGATINVSRKGNDGGCRVSGTDEQIARAKELIQAILAKVQEQDEKAEAARADAEAAGDDVNTDAGTNEAAAFVGVSDDDQGTGW